jgi:alkylation response protein AidB-like acyl-CoA dehydrogenase
MEFVLTPDQQRIHSLARALAVDFATRAAEHDRDASPPVENYAALREAGFFGLTMPKAFAGWGVGLLGYTIAAEELAQGCASTALSFNMHAGVLAGLMSAPLPEATKRWVAELATKEGKLMAAIFSGRGPPVSSRPAYACSTRARRVSGGHQLTGTKGFCSMVESSDYLCVFAHPEEVADPQTGLMMLVPNHLPGMRIERVWDTLGMRGTRSDNLILDHCFVPEEAVLGEPIPNLGAWFAAIEAVFNIPYTAVYLGIGVAALRASIDSVTHRRPKGYRQSLAYHPDIRRRIAIMSAQLEAARWLLRYAAWLEDTLHARQAQADHTDQDTPTVEAQAAESLATYLKAKYVVGEAVAAATRSALEMGGAHALFKPSTIERLFRHGATATIQHPPSDYCLSALSTHELQLDPKAVHPPLLPRWT